MFSVLVWTLVNTSMDCRTKANRVDCKTQYFECASYAPSIYAKRFNHMRRRVECVVISFSLRSLISVMLTPTHVFRMHTNRQRRRCVFVCVCVALCHCCVCISFRTICFTIGREWRTYKIYWFWLWFSAVLFCVSLFLPSCAPPHWQLFSVSFIHCSRWRTVRGTFIRRRWRFLVFSWRHWFRWKQSVMCPHK